MHVYQPSPELTSSTVKAILSTLPFFVRTLAKMIPAAAMARVVEEALTRVVPIALSAMASTQPIGTAIPLTRARQLTAVARDTIIKRIATWLVPDEISEVTALLNSDILKLAHEQFSGGSWRLEERNSEAILVVTGQPLLKETGDTVADAVFHSFESLGKVKDRLSGYFNPPART